MQPIPNSILDAALKLTETERLWLAAQLLETVPEEPVGLSIDDPDLMEELKRRSADREASVPWTEVRQQL
jgi:hypothetical protein